MRIKLSQDLVHTHDMPESAKFNRLIVTPTAVVGKHDGINISMISMVVI